MMTPESIGGGAELEYQSTGFSNGVLDFSNNSTQNALLMGKVTEEQLYFAVGVSESADLFIKVPKESSSMVGLKIQLIGTPAKAATEGHSLAFTLAMGSERDTFDQVFTIDLKSDVRDYAIIHGYRLSPILLIYDGISISNYSFEGAVKGDSGLASDSIEYTAKNIIGAHGGIVLGSHSFKLKLELAMQKIAWSHTEEKVFQNFGMTLSAGW